MTTNPNDKVIQMDDQQAETDSKPVPCTDRVAIFAKIASIMGKVESLSKNAQNSHFKYKYVSADAVFDSCRKLMSEEKLVIIPHMEEITQENGRTSIDFVFTLCCAETGATLNVKWAGEALGKDDKGINKCATTALKYFLMKLFVIDTGNPDNDADSGGENKSGGNQSSTPQGPVSFPISKLSVTRQKKNPEQQMYVVKGSKKNANMFSSDMFKKAGYDTSDWKLAEGQQDKEVSLDPPARVTVVTNDKGYLEVTAVVKETPAQAKGTADQTSDDAPSTETDQSTTKGQSSKGKSSSKTNKKTRPKTLMVETMDFEFDGDHGYVAVEEHDCFIFIDDPVAMFEPIVEDWPEDAAEDKWVTVELMVESSLTCKAKITKDKQTGEILGHYVVTEAT